MRIMIVEDHDAVRASVRDLLLAGLPEASVVEAATGEQALEIASDTRCDFVVMDLGLPGMTGFEATKRLGAVSPLSRVVVCTVHEGPVYRQAAVVAGAVGFLAKREANERLVPMLLSFGEQAPEGGRT